MKRLLLSISIIIAVITLSGCSKIEIIKETITREKEYIIDYSSSTSFENVLNENKDVNGKIVKVLVFEVLESNDILTKFKTGKSLVFNTNKSIKIEEGDYIVVKIIDKPSKIEDKWQINFELVKVIETENNKNDNAEDIPDNEEIIIENQKIKIDRASSNYIGLDKTQIEKEFKEKGFVNIELKESKTTDSNNKNNTILSITINGNEFNKDQEFNKEDKVVITYLKYEKTASEYEFAFIREAKYYDMYYMFDADTNKVIYFTTDYDKPEKGMYSGTFNTGVTINWEHGEFTEKFVNKNGSSSAMLIDANGFEWKYEKCSISKAQNILDNLK